jgi:purine-binding chemotaxis protein CheW
MLLENHESGGQAVTFLLDGRRYALPMDSVERVIRAVAVTPVPEVPEYVLGLINMAGRILPVVSLRTCLGLPDRPVRPDDQFVIVRTSGLTVALVVDEVRDLCAVAASGDESLPDGCRARGLLRVDGDIILIYDLNTLISREEQERIARIRDASKNVI